jgi:hypothetical protein
MAKPPTYFQERKDFLGRMIPDHSKIQWRVEMGHTKKIFFVDHKSKTPKELRYPIEFLNKVAPAFKNMNSVCYFLGEKGKAYLETELNKFNFKPKTIESVEQEEKIGEDKDVKAIPSLRQFLNE